MRHMMPPNPAGERVPRTRSRTLRVPTPIDRSVAALAPLLDRTVSGTYIFLLRQALRAQQEPARPPVVLELDVCSPADQELEQLPF
jgi:hypothetical protein